MTVHDSDGAFEGTTGRRSFVKAAAAMAGVAALTPLVARAQEDRDYGPDGPPVHYPDPDVVSITPAFDQYKVGNSAIQRLWTGGLWLEGPAWSGVGDLDLFHAEEHLWAVAHDLHGKGTPQAQAWVAPLLQQIHDDQTVAVIATLAELKPSLLEAQQKKIQTQIEYFEHNADRMKYKEILEA